MALTKPNEEEKGREDKLTQISKSDREAGVHRKERRKRNGEKKIPSYEERDDTSGYRAKCSKKK